MIYYPRIRNFVKKAVKNIIDPDAFSDYLVMHLQLSPNFIDKKTLEFSGKEYYEEQVYKAIKAASNYENSVIIASLDSLNIKDAWQQIKKSCVMIYLKESFEPISSLDNENKVNELVFEDRDIFLEEKADILVNNLENEENCLPKIFTAMKKYYNLC